MTAYEFPARTILNHALWENLTSYSVLNSADYVIPNITNPLIPIIPIQEVQEFNNLLPGKTYIVYDYEAFTQPSDDWFKTEEYIVYSIVSSSYNKIVEITELMVDLFRRYDDSGRDISELNYRPDLFKFYSSSVYGINSPAPYENESSLMSGEVSIMFCYSRILNSQGRFA